MYFFRKEMIPAALNNTPKTLTLQMENNFHDEIRDDPTNDNLQNRLSK